MPRPAETSARPPGPRIGSDARIAKLTLHTLLAALVVAGAAFAWQARGEGPSTTAASLAEVLGHEIDLDDED